MNDLLIFLKNDWRIFLNLRRQAKEQSVFKMMVVGAFGVLLLAGLFLLFLDGFKFLGSLGGVGIFIIQHLFGFFFFGLGFMLVLSNIITAYASCFHSDDIPFLLLQPVSRGVIAVHKLFASALLSSWAFFFIMVPFVAAFAWHQKMPLSFAFWTVVFSIPFVVLCSGLGTILIIVAARILPRLRLWMWFVLAAAALCAFFLFSITKGAERGADAPFYLMGLIPGIKLASSPLLPSWWVAEGIMAMVRGGWDRGLMLLFVLIANLLLVIMIAEMTGGRLFCRAWERIVSGAERKGIRRAESFNLFGWIAGYLPPEYRAIIGKDLRSLLRDPTQVIQGLLFFGLLGIYFFNLRNFHYHLLPPVWRNLISFLNLFSLATIMASFCSRFIFPQISLEGHSFWIIGLSPVGMGRILKIKYIFSVLTMLLISGTLMLVSTLMLGVQVQVLLITIAVSVAMSFALCALALGLGTIFMDLKQTNPVAIISGFGGTFNLVMSLIYIMAAILPFGFLCHEHILGSISRSLFIAGVVLAGVWLLLITFLASFMPLMIGRRSLKANAFFDRTCPVRLFYL